MLTLEDIARKAGFSSMTVSRYFNDPSRVKPATRAIIRRVVEELNYSPNSVAKSLAKKCTSIIYIYMAPDLEVMHPFVQLSVAALGERLGEYGYSFLLSRKMYTDESCDGVIAIGMTLSQENVVAHFQKKPLVLFGNSKETSNWVDVDNYRGSYDMTNFLLDKGCKKIAYIGINQEKRYGFDRFSAYRDCMNARGDSFDESLVRMCDNKESAGYKSTKSLLEAGIRPDAIECASDLLALGCIRALNEASVSVPDDMMVTGFDGLGYEMIAHPRITTVRQPIYEVGLKLADIMVDILRGNAPHKGVYVVPEIVEHGSTRKNR